MKMVRIFQSSGDLLNTAILIIGGSETYVPIT
jgi:hypothetical protein